ncbi:MAG: DUF1592 domain-containing protein [Acidobacteria bacterium]|nr:DUF1592 domain-containing protein [Acidobacteriota bacterium]
MIPILRLQAAFLGSCLAAGAQPYSLPDAQAFLKTHCLLCHRGKAAPGGFDVTRYSGLPGMVADAPRWNSAIVRIREGSMPPPGARAIPQDERERFTGWLSRELKSAVCSSNPVPAPVPIRRLNRDEYAATIRDLLNVHVNAAHALPVDGAGGEGFDNAAETLTISPIHAEKYLDAAKEALQYAASEPKSRELFLIAQPGPGKTPDQAAEEVLASFVPRAFRRPVRPAELAPYLALFRMAAKRGEPYEDALLFALQGVLVSPRFLFHVEAANNTAQLRPLDSYDLASRLSYFLWGSMPDKVLTDLASAGTLNDPAVLHAQIPRMLKDVKATEFAQRFVEQWLGTRELGRDIQPDAKLFPQYYEAELQSAIRYEPILFFQELLANNLSLLNLIDSKFTILTNKLQRHYGLPKTDIGQQPKRVELPENSHRGGVLSMAAVLAVSSYPQRTSPVLRGKWALDALLGTPPPPPPPNVPVLAENHAGEPARTLRQRLTEHRRDPVCASCHSRIDPIGFGLENYDVLGRWRTEDAGQPIDSHGELPGGIQFEGPEQLKAVLLSKKDLFFHNLTAKMLGYALGRGLTPGDQCVVDGIVEKLAQNDYSAHTLVEEIVLSAPFRMQPGPSNPSP